MGLGLDTHIWTSSVNRRPLGPCPWVRSLGERNGERRGESRGLSSGNRQQQRVEVRTSGGLVLVSWSCQSKRPQAEQLKTPDTFSCGSGGHKAEPKVAAGPRSFQGASGRILPASSSSWGWGRPLACGRIAPLSVSIITWPSPLLAPRLLLFCLC